MVISKLTLDADGWHRFNLNVGGFTIRNCRWHPPTKRIFFPVRYDQFRHKAQKVIFVYGAHVKRLRELLESGQTSLPRDRRPCLLKISSLKPGRYLSMKGEQWYLFNFTVRGFTILGCRWLPEFGSIQLPVTFYKDFVNDKVLKKPVVCAYGAHINRLRAALEAIHPKIAALAA